MFFVVFGFVLSFFGFGGTGLGRLAAWGGVVGVPQPRPAPASFWGHKTDPAKASPRPAQASFWGHKKDDSVIQDLLINIVCFINNYGSQNHPFCDTRMKPGLAWGWLWLGPFCDPRTKPGLAWGWPSPGRQTAQPGPPKTKKT